MSSRSPYGQIIKKGAGLLSVNLRHTGWTEHFVFLIDTSGSMRIGGVASQFAKIHGELLDRLADEHPGALVSCLTFAEDPFTQYASRSIESAPSLTMRATGGTDLPVAICSELEKVINEHIGQEIITAIIVTDGDTDSHTGRDNQYAARRAVNRMRASGVKFLFLVATNDSSDTPSASVIASAEKVGIRPSEVMLWGHTAKDLSKTFSKVGEKLALGEAKRDVPKPKSPPEPPSLVALPPHRPL